MRLTLKVTETEYIDFEIDIQNKLVKILSPIPNLTEDDLKDLVALSAYDVFLPITSTLYKIKNYEQDIPDPKTSIGIILLLTNYLITDK